MQQDPEFEYDAASSNETVCNSEHVTLFEDDQKLVLQNYNITCITKVGNKFIRVLYRSIHI